MLIITILTIITGIDAHVPHAHWTDWIDFNPNRTAGITHTYLPLDTGASLAAFQYGDLESRNLFFFIGGLFDGLFTVAYSPYLGHALSSSGWSSIQCLLTSSYSYWGFSSLDRDAYEISECINYFISSYGGRNQVGNIVLMGSSTGANDIMWYLTKGNVESRTKIDAAILQGPVSDRDYIVAEAPEGELLQQGQALAQQLIDSGNATEPMPVVYQNVIYESPLTAYRFNSLSKVGGDDDFFSKDLSDETLSRTFGKLGVPALIMMSGADEYVPEKVDKEALLARFVGAQDPRLRSRYSGINPEALHAVPENPGRDDLTARVQNFLKNEVNGQS